MKTRYDSRWRITPVSFLATLIVAAIVFMVACGGQPGKEEPSTTVPPPKAVVDPPLEEVLTAGVTATVRVTLGAPAATDIKGQLQHIDQTQDHVLSQVSTQDFELVHRYQTMPALVGVVTREGLDALLNQTEVQSVALDASNQDELIESAILIKAYDVWRSYSLTGAGVNVAVLDTGIDNRHTDLEDNIVDQHCFVACADDDPNNAQDDNGHGTHVAGIITGRGQVSPRGIAPDAGIVAVRVMDTTATDTIPDVVAGIDWVVANQTRLNIRIINLGMHRGKYEGVCDAEIDPSLVEAVERARQAGIVIFAPTGNGGLAEMMAAPACMSGVVSVGMTDKSGQLSRGNSSSALDLLAPGISIVSTAPGGDRTYNGTSHASPHAAAVAALMLQANPNLSAAEIETILKETGVPLADSRNGRITPLIDALAAVTRVVGDKSD